MSIPEAGKKAPAFTAKDQNEKSHKLSDYKGQWVALYFYPKDNTPTCSTQACNLRDNIALLKKNKVQVLGVSPDDAKSHKKFEEKFDLPFPLLIDADKKIMEKYGVWGEKQMYGRTYMGVKRTTYLINEEGKIAHVFLKPKSKEHAEEILSIING
jgi:peroxiredoxin Q/BCP